MIANLRDSLKAGRSGEVADLLKDIHDAARALRTEMDLSGDSPGRASLRPRAPRSPSCLQAEIDNLPGQVRRLLRPRTAKEIAPTASLDAGDVDEIEAKLVLAAACRNYAGELAISEVTRRVHSDLQNYFDTGTQSLLDRLRARRRPSAASASRRSTPRCRFCAKLFGADYASTLAKAADVAAKGEQKAAKALDLRDALSRCLDLPHCGACRGRRDVNAAMTLWFLFAPDDRGGDFRRAVAARARRARAARRQRCRGLSRPARRDRARPRGRPDRRGRSRSRARRSVAPADRGGGCGAGRRAPRRGATFRRRAAARRRAGRAAARSRPRSISRSARRNCRASRSPAASRRRCRIARSTRWSRRSRRILRRIPRTAAAGRWSAPVYMRLGRFEDAVKARRNALRLNGASARPRGRSRRGADGGGERRRHRRGEGGIRARADARRRRHPRRASSSASRREQDGQSAKARGDLARHAERRAGRTRPGSGMVRAGAGARRTGAAVAPPGPSAEDVAAAEQDESEDRAAMVRGMVERLAER